MTILQKSTTNCAKFRLHEQNRLVTNGNGYVTRKDLIQSMNAEGFRKECAITCYANEEPVPTH